MPHVAEVRIDSELFLVLFIAPLLFNEACESSKRELWNSLPSILSLAIGLVPITVLVVGFALHWMVPSIPLTAAFACAAALGSTDAAAVTGAFSAADAGVTFLVLFFGGIAFGIVAGSAAFFGITLLRRRGFENNIVHVPYEVFTPFVVFLLAEELHVSGILAVVAAGGLPMQRARSSRSIEASSRRCRSAWAIRTSSRAWARARCSIRRPAC